MRIGVSTRSMNDEEKEYLSKPQKRERKVFPNEMLCHVWANQNQESGRNANNSLYFTGDEIYSYGSHYLAAKIFTRSDGSKYALINSDTYSSTTSQHLWDIKKSLKGLMSYVEVPDPSDPLSEANRDFYIDRVINLLDHLYSTRKKMWLTNIKEFKLYIEHNINEHLRFLGHEEFVISDEDLDAIEFLFKEREAFANCPKRLAKIAKAKELEAKRMREEYAVHIHYYNTFDQGNITQAVERFRSFESNTVGLLSVRYNDPLYLNYKIRMKLIDLGIEIKDHVEDAGTNEYLRVKDDVVQTSRGAEVPLSHATRILKMWLKDEEIKKGERIGHFTVDHTTRISDTDRVIKIGCHNILLSEAMLILGKYIKLELV